MIIFLVEDYSMRKFLEGILPRLGFEKHKFEIKHHRGKEDLISHLNNIIPSLSKRFKASAFQAKKKYRDIDKIEKPSSVIEKIVPDWKDKYASKPKFAEEIASFISLETQDLEQSNRSHSFHVLLKTLQIKD